MRRPVIAVFGSGEQDHAPRAEPLGRWIATHGYDLLTGGGPGVMGAACRGFAAVGGRAGQSIGILPDTDRSGYPNPWVDIAIQTHLSAKAADPLDRGSRNHINVLSCNVAVALPGGVGTRSELALCVHYERPVVAWGWCRDELPVCCAGLPCATSLDEVCHFVEGALRGPTTTEGGRP